MKNYTPKQVEQHLEKLFSQYEEAREAYAIKVFNEAIRPRLEQKNLSFCMMNGFPRVYDINGDSIEVPQFILKYFDLNEPTGREFAYDFPDYNPHNQNFSDNDRKAFDKRPTQELCAYIFSSAMGGLR